MALETRRHFDVLLLKSKMKVSFVNFPETIIKSSYEVKWNYGIRKQIKRNYKMKPITYEKLVKTQMINKNQLTIHQTRNMIKE
jgi:hypothetical protein